MFENFSRRHGLDKHSYDLKYEYVPPAFRMDLFKSVTEQFEDATSPTVREYVTYLHAAVSVNKEPTLHLYDSDEIEQYYNSLIFIDFILELQWHELLSVVEFFVNSGYLKSAAANRLLAYHGVGYRIDEEGLWTDKKKVVVHYEGLIQDTIQLLSEEIPFEPVVEAIRAAQKALVNPSAIDVATSVSAAVNAVEGYVKGMLAATSANGKAPSNLGDCVKELRKDSSFPVNILESLEKLYVFRNRTENVGHGAPSFGNLEVEDALLCVDMAVSFINYFHRKSSKQ
jgi:hypothetical protein